jgi:anti-sigma-K factor RskA
MRGLLGAFALGAVDEDEEAAVRAYLVTSAEAREELAELMAATDALALTAEPMAPPPALRERISAAVLAEAGPAAPPPTPKAAPPAPPAPPAPVPIRRTAPVWSLSTPWAAAAAALLLVAVGLLLWNMQLREQLASTPTPQVVALAGTDAAPNARGEVRYLPDERLFYIDVRDLPPLAEGHVYEVWLIGDQGTVPAGVFDQSTAQHAVVADRSQFTTLAITVEPGPIGTDAPTGEIVATATL